MLLGEFQSGTDGRWLAKMTIEAIIQALRQKAAYDVEHYLWVAYLSRDEKNDEIRKHICSIAADVIEGFMKKE
jgi:hypothetical protein